MKVEPTDRFKKDVKFLKKRFPKVTDDIRSFYYEIIKNPTIGTNLGNNCYKVRLANSSIPTGKSGGFRVITYHIYNEKIFLLTIYSKSEKENISTKELEDILKNIK